MNNDPNDTPLMNALAAVETCFVTPFVPGELESWASHARGALDTLNPLLRQHIRKVHAPQLKQIGDEDPELFHQVEHVRQGDQRTIEMMEQLQRTLQSLDTLAPQIEPDETKFKTQLDDLAQEGVAFVIHVRSQSVALRTWLQEAFNRDRGTVD